MSVESGYTLDRDDRGITGRERTVMELFRNGATYSEIAEELGITKQRVGQIVSSLVKKKMLVRGKDGTYGVVIKR